MNKLNFHETSIPNRYPPPLQVQLPVIQKLVAAYTLWHQFLPHIPKTSRYTLGSKIDSLFIEIVEALYIASYLNKSQKMPYVQRAITKLDVLKFFMQVAWEIKVLDNKKFITLSEKLNEVGKMLGGWNKQLTKENPAMRGEK